MLLDNDHTHESDLMDLPDDLRAAITNQRLAIVADRCPVCKCGWLHSLDIAVLYGLVMMEHKEWCTASDDAIDRMAAKYGLLGDRRITNLAARLAIDP